MAPLCAVIREATRHSRSISTPRFMFPASVPGQARSFKSAANRRGHAGLAQVPIPERPMYGDIPSQALPNIDPCAPLRPSPSPHQTRQDYEQVVQPTNQTPAFNVEEILELNAQTGGEAVATPVYHRGSKFDRIPYWQKIGRWKDILENQFLSYRWNVSHVNT